MVEWARKLLADVEATGRTVHWVHVKGHSADGGNDRANELVQCGKTGGPYCRVWEGGGEGEGRYGAVTTVVPWTATEGDSAMGRSTDRSHRGRAVGWLTPRSMCSIHFLRE